MRYIYKYPPVMALCNWRYFPCGPGQNIWVIPVRFCVWYSKIWRIFPLFELLNPIVPLLKKAFFTWHSKIWLTFTYLNSWILLVQFSRKQFWCGTQKSGTFLTFWTPESFWSNSQENQKSGSLLPFELLSPIGPFLKKAQKNHLNFLA